jgi:copper chaperone CopZ
MTTSSEIVYRVDGMACGACKLAIREYVGRVVGVAEVDVDLDGGTVTVRGEDLDDGALRAEIAEAGYEVRR